MRFNIMIVDPPGYQFAHFLFSSCKLLCHGLESLGHDCSITRNAIERDRMTILVGGHLLRAPGDVEAIAGCGPYVVYQTEIIQHDAVNLSGDRPHFQSVYVPLLQRAEAVWEGYTHQVSLLASLGARGQLLLGGYHPAMEEVVHKRNKDVDFLFFGSITPYRREMLTALKSRGYKVLTLFDEHALFRDDMIARTKVNLSPRQGPVMNHLPFARLLYLLNNRSLVVVEQCLEQEWLQECFPWAESAHWLDLCEETLLRNDREQLTAEFADRFRARPFTDVLLKVLDEM